MSLMLIYGFLSDFCTLKEQMKVKSAAQVIYDDTKFKAKAMYV